MRRLLPLLAVALCLAALCAVHVTEVSSQERRYPEPPSPTIPKPSPPGAAKQVLEALSGLSQSLENGDITDISPDDLARHFKAAAAMQGASNVVADVLEDPRVGFQTSGEVSAKVHKLFNAKLEKEGGTVKGGLENKFLGLTIDGTPGDRKIGATFTIGTGNLHGTYEFKRQFSVEFSYRNNEDYVRAMGIDAGNIPGARTVLTLMNRMSGTIQPEDKSPPPAGVMDAALGQIKSMLPPIFEAGAKFETATFGNAVSVTRDGVELSFTKKERIRPGDPQATPEQFTETKAAFKAEREFKSGVLKAGVAAGITYSTEPGLVNSPEKQALIADIRRNGLFHAATESLKKAVIAEKADEIGAAHTAITAMPHAPIADTDRILAVNDPKVGGVMLHFSPDLFATGVPPASVAGMLAGFAETQSRHGSNFIVTAPNSAEDYHIVSLSSLLDSGTDTVGGLTRITGCVTDSATGDVAIIGRIEPGCGPVPMDVLVVGMRAIWKDGGTPFISLDAVPGAEFGPQNSRIGGMAKELQQSQFVLDMLDADYAMKQINLGTLSVDAPGFRSARQIQEASDDMTEGMTRYWLYPKQAAAADVWFHEADGRQVLCFDSQICVLTERMHQISSLSTGIPQPDPLAEEAARLFTRHFPAIAAQHPVFHRLYGVFDVAKLAAVLRHRKVRSPVLDRLCAREFRKVTVPASYDGIGPIFIRDSSMYIGGGARTKVRLAPGTVVPSPDLSVFLTAGHRQTVETSLPASSVLLPGAVRCVAAEVLAGQGMALYGQMKYREARDLLDEAIEADPSIEEALMYRALASHSLGDIPGALADAEAYAAINPEMRGFLGLMRMHTGGKEQALADVRACRRQHRDSESALRWSALVHVLALELDDADAEADELIAMSPQGSDGYEIRDVAATLRRLGPERAAIRVHQLMTTPVPIADATASGSARMQGLDFDGAVQEFEAALGLSKAASGDAKLAGLYLVERAEMALAMALSMRSKFVKALGDTEAAERDATRSVDICRGLQQRHPNWPSGHLLLAVVSLTGGGSGDTDRAYEAFRTARGLPAAGDALMEEFAIHFGADNALALFGLMLFQQGKLASDEAKVSLLNDVVKLLGTGLAAKIWDLPAKYHDKPALFSLKCRQLEKEIPDNPENLDPVTLYSLSFFYTMLVGMGTEKYEQGDLSVESADHQIHLITKYLALSDRSDMPVQMMAQIATFRFAMLGLLGDAYQRKLGVDSRMREVYAKLADGSMDIGTAVAISRRVKDEVLEKAREKLSPLALMMVRSAFDAPKSDQDLYYIAKAEPPTDDSPDSGMSRMVERFGKVADSARSPMEIRTMLAFVDLMNKAMSVAPGEGADMEKHAQAVQAFSILRAKLMMKVRLPARPVATGSRAWLTVSMPGASGEPGGAVKPAPAVGFTPPSQSESGAPQPAQAGTGISVSVLLIGGVLGAAMLGVLLILVMGRKGAGDGRAESR